MKLIGLLGGEVMVNVERLTASSQGKTLTFHFSSFPPLKGMQIYPKISAWAFSSAKNRIFNGANYYFLTF